MKRKVFTASIVCLMVVALPGLASAAERQLRPAQQHVQPFPRQIAGTLKVNRPPNGDTTILFWNGKIFPPMAKQLAKAIADNKATSNRFLLVLNSPGGSVIESEKVIALLQELKKTHQLDTAVHAGKMCGSMCPFIYAQGQRRMAAPASMWLFHEILHWEPGQTPYLERQTWLKLVEKYWVPAGVSPEWISSVKSAVKNRDVYASGDSLIANGSNFITKQIPDAQYRNIASGPQERAQ